MKRKQFDRALLLGAFLASWLPSGVSMATEVGDVGGHPLRVDVTETAIVNYNTDNRNDNWYDPGTHLDDDWGVWTNRFNIGANWYRLTFGLRLDSSLFFHTPDPNELAREDMQNVPPPRPGELRDPDFERTERRRRIQVYGTDLSNRYLNTIYPSKVFLTYVSPHFEATVGDVYAQFGRGLVLSVRKVDELAVDTTIRGGKVRLRAPMPKGMKLQATAVGGYMNPLRVDEGSGRILQAPSAWYFAGMPQPVDTPYVSPAQPTYVPDQLVGASIEGGWNKAYLGVHGVRLERGDVFNNRRARGASQIRNISASLTVPDLWKHGAAYVEVASQERDYEESETDLSEEQGPGTSGYAVYASISANQGPLSLTVEGKHYRSFFPLEASIDTGPQAHVNEFRLIQYSAPPTTLPIYVDTETNFFNTCVTGGRARLDGRVTDDLLVYGWVGRYSTWGERSAGTCDIVDENRNDVWDTAVGFEANFEHHRTHAYAWLGARDDANADVGQTAPGESRLYYRETYVRYDLLKKLSSRFSLQMAGFVRRRHDPTHAELPWWEGENYTALQWSPHLTAAFGYEYITRPGVPTHYLNGSVKWRFDSQTSVRAFVGQQRGALRCISGVCREFPPFEGAKLEATVRF